MTADKKPKAVTLEVKLANIEKAKKERQAINKLQAAARQKAKKERQARRRANRSGGGGLAGLRQIGSKTTASRTSRSSIKTK
jgi:hypothetical protein